MCAVSGEPVSGCGHDVWRGRVGLHAVEPSAAARGACESAGQAAGGCKGAVNRISIRREIVTRCCKVHQLFIFSPVMRGILFEV